MPDAALRAVLSPDGPLGHAIAGLAPGARPVRLVAFDKRPEANWVVPWHQDRVIAVRARAEVPGFTAWSRKGDTWHCEPPETILAAMLFVRVHLDDQDDRNGAMQIAPGSHRLGKVPAAEAARRAEEIGGLSCAAARGDVLVLDMLTLHRSLPSTSSAPRRTLRIDYAATDLPPPLEWAL
ncbi:MAG: phytanoyl-CoA dioxygenase family protein [Maritimibacter sp.]|nr:phytanoyl-CoA dioxygenase family protein [Maritimibacter sp.]